MDQSGKFLLPSPKFKKLEPPSTATSHFLSPQGMLLPKEQQPPPMYGPRGSTIPGRFLAPQTSQGPSNQFDKPKKYFCEPCEAEFHTSTDYRVHKNEHIECEIGNCTIKVHPSFISTHIEQQHLEGFYDKFKRLSTPEEIAQWRADRIKNYPTLANVEQKWKAYQQRMLRGERLAENCDGFGKPFGRRPMRYRKVEMVADFYKQDGNKRRRKRNRTGKQSAQKECKQKKAEEKTEPAEKEEKNDGPSCSGLQMFKGTAGMPGYKKPKKAETHALSSLLGMYGSDSDDEGENSGEETCEENEQPQDGNVEEEPAKVPEEKPYRVDEDFVEELTRQETTNEDFFYGEPVSKIRNPNLSDEDDDESPDESPDEAPISRRSNIPEKPIPEAPKKRIKPSLKKRNAIKSGIYRHLRRAHQNTMLEMLLERDIYHERNVMLQCVRFVMENNFFDARTLDSRT